jgi:plasmid stability protein
MPITLTIRNVPDDVAARLRILAARNHRSLQGEMMAMLSERAHEKRAKSEKPSKMTVREIAEEIRELGLPRPETNESTQMIRQDRDSR